MSIAWGSLVLLIVLLPGVLFFVGTYWPEQFTRESESRSPLGQLAGALLVAFFVHGLAYAVLGEFCGTRVPCISVDGLLRIVHIDPSNQTGSLAVDKMLFEYRWWIFTYVMTASAIGIILGAIYGSLVAAGRIRRFSRHSWIYDLSTDGLTYAYVLTHVRQDNRILLYKGFVRAFGLQQDGKFSYIVLTDVARMYLTLDKKISVTSAPDVQRVIGASGTGDLNPPRYSTKPRRRVQSLFVIEGEDIANAVFDVLETDAEPIDRDELRMMIKEEVQDAGISLTDEQIEELLGP